MSLAHPCSHSISDTSFKPTDTARGISGSSSENSPSIEAESFLRRLAYLERWGSMMRDFGRSQSYLCSITRDVIFHLVRRYKAMLEWDYRRLTLETLLRYASNVNKKCGYSNIWGFIDGTFYRPTENQRLVSSGYKRAHGFKYQAVVTPDGLITSLFGPMEGKIGDWNMLKESGLEDILKNINSLFPDGHHLYIYGDPAYSEGYGIMGPFKLTPSHLVLTREESEFNVRMSGVRIAVEQLFGLVLNKWAYNGYKYGLRQQSTAVAAHYMVSVLLTNIQTCLEGGNEVSQSFHCIPPSLDDYLKLD